MSSGYGSLPRARYSGVRRAAIVAGCASVLTGTAIALPAATFAEARADTPPIANLDLGGAAVKVPDLGLPLPDVEVDTKDLPVATLTETLDVGLTLDTAPEAADAEPTTTEPTTTEPTTSEPTTSEPSAAGPTTTAPATTEPVAAIPGDDARRTMSDPTSIEPVPDLPSEQTRVSSGRSTPASAVAAPAPAGPSTTTRPVAEDQIVSTVIGPQDRQSDQRAAIRAAQLAAQQSAPALISDAVVEKDWLTAPLTVVEPRGGADTVDLAARNGPDSASGDWNLLPEALYAVLPLMLAGAAVVAHGRRNARVAAPSSAVLIQRRRHANVR